MAPYLIQDIFPEPINVEQNWDINFLEEEHAYGMYDSGSDDDDYRLEQRNIVDAVTEMNEALFEQFDQSESYMLPCDEAAN